jgi:hypothetical protein
LLIEHPMRPVQDLDSILGVAPLIRARQRHPCAVGLGYRRSVGGRHMA